jgi:hypothetical protein
MKINKLGNLLLSPDEATGEGEVDPLAEAAGAVDTSFPLLSPDRPLRWECISAKVAPSKADPSRNGLTLILKTTTETTFQNGKKAHPGFKVYKRYGVSVTPPTADSDGRTIDAIKKDLAFVLKAFFGAKAEVTPRALLDNPAMLEGRMVDGKTTIEKGSGGFADKTGVTFIIPAA